MKEKFVCWTRRATRDEAGQSLIILVVAFFALLVIIGLAVDLGLIREHHEAVSITYVLRFCVVGRCPPNCPP